MGYKNVPVSVNVSRSDIYHIELADCLTEMVKKYGLKPSALHLEITESAFAEDMDQIIGTVGHLRELGFVIEMDDFGSGYSSLNALSQMKLDILKLDMRFIQGEGDAELNRGVLQFVVNLAQWMNLRVTAEGVETREQADQLREIGCDYVQGYLFARPMKHEDYEMILEKLCKRE